MNATALRAALAAAGLATALQAGAQCQPLEKNNPNASDQRPAFAGQTRACGTKSDTRFDVKVIAKGLEHPWAVEPLPGGGFLVTERPGRMRVISADGKVGEPLSGLPEVHAKGQGGLLDVALSPTFEKDRTVYWAFSEPRNVGNGTAVARGVLSRDNRALEQVKTILSTKPTYNNDMHFGSRLAFGPDGMLYVTMGDRSHKPMRPQAQDLASHLGKTLRVTTDGKPAPGNPFAGRVGVLPETWSLGHRNIQGSAFDANGQFWVIEHGTRGGDELNRIEKGKNYGWPEAAYGIEYNGSAIPGAVTAKEGTEQPTYYWDPVIAPSGAQFYTGSAFPEWKGSLFIAALGQKRLVRLVMEGNKVKAEEHLLVDRGRRMRDVRQGPDGALYLVTDEANGELLRVGPVK
jgi:glucose/arabinose dehydrogenase